MKVKRRQSRETAFSLIFEWGFREEETVEDILAQATVGRQLEVDEFALALATRTIENCPQLDTIIKQYSQKWKLKRIPRVTLAVLRMSFCELSMFQDIPVGATINEAVELVKKYATEEDAAYLNGILGQYDRDRRGIVSEEDTGDELEDAEAETEEDEAEEEEAEAAPEDSAAEPASGVQ